MTHDITLPVTTLFRTRPQLDRWRVLVRQCVDRLYLPRCPRLVAPLRARARRDTHSRYHQRRYSCPHASARPSCHLEHRPPLHSSATLPRQHGCHTRQAAPLNSLHSQSTSVRRANATFASSQRVQRAKRTHAPRARRETSHARARRRPPDVLLRRPWVAFFCRVGTITLPATVTTHRPTRPKSGIVTDPLTHP
jgi:hypothetical protein